MHVCQEHVERPVCIHVIAVLRAMTSRLQHDILLFDESHQQLWNSDLLCIKAHKYLHTPSVSTCVYSLSPSRSPRIEMIHRRVLVIVLLPHECLEFAYRAKVLPCNDYRCKQTVSFAGASVFRQVQATRVHSYMLWYLLYIQYMQYVLHRFAYPHNGAHMILHARRHAHR
jgi:hypothetical protein